MDEINGAARPPRGAPPPAGAVHRVAAEDAVRALVEALGLRLSPEARANTPRRVVDALREMTAPAPFRPTTFAHAPDDEMPVVVRDIAFRALCEHHLLPFAGVAHVGYVPDGRVLGLSKLPRLVEACAAGPQLQERLTRAIADGLERAVRPRGVGVVVEAVHMCMAVRGVRQAGSATVTRVMRGAMRDPAMAADLQPGAGRPRDPWRSAP